MAAARSANPLFVPRVLWGAMFASTFAYLYVYFFAAPKDVTPPDFTMPIALGATALVCAVLSFVVPGKMHRKAARASKLDVKEVPDPNASVMFRDQTPTVRVFAEPDAVVKHAMRLYFTPFILSLALTEAVAIYGLVLGFIGFGLEVVLPFFIVAWILFIPRFPRLENAVGPLEDAHDARLAV